MRQLIGTLLLFAATMTVFPQSAANYTASRTTGITYTPLSSGSTFTWRNGTDTDDNRSDATNIGFDFWFLGTRITQFSANTNGVIDFAQFDNASGVSGGSFDGDNQKFFYQSYTIAPMYDNLAVSSLNNIKYEVSGSFPSRVLTVEWSGADVSGDTSPDLNFQVKLYEGTGVVEFIYGTMTAGSASYSYTVGIHDEGGDGTPEATEALVQQTANTATFSNTPVFNLSTIPASNSKIELTPPTATLPTNLSFTNVKWNRMTLNWTDNATNELHYAIYRSDDGGTTFSFVDTVDPGTTSFTNYALSFNTSYQWRVCAVTEGGLGFSIAATQATNSGLLNGTYTVGPTGNYATLTDAIAAIRTDGVIGAVIFELQSTYTSTGETFPINLLDSSWASASKTITIRPASGATGLTITTNNSTGTLRLNDAHYFSIDGRPGGTGSAKELTIENTTTTGYAVEFNNEASYNTIKYCTIKGISKPASEGQSLAVVIFNGQATDDYGNTNTTGNLGNTIDNCDLRDGASTPQIMITCLGITAIPDSGNTISNNNIYNFFAADMASYGIYISNGKNWTISGNSFYQTSSRAATAARTHTGIALNGTTVGDVTISGNYIGGGNSGAGGSPWTVTSSSVAAIFTGISLNGGSSNTASVQNNTIKNFDWSTSSSAATFGGVFCGVSALRGNVLIGSVTGNVIGASTGTGSILVTGSSTGASVNPIFSVATGTVTISNNVIGSITTTGTSTSISVGVRGITISSAPSATVSNNLFGSLSTANSINASNASTSTTAQNIWCIFSTATGATFSNNTIANVNNNYAYSSATSGQIIGIWPSNGVNTVTGNTIRNLSTSSPNTSTNTSASLFGIQLTAGYDNQTISENTIYALSNTASSAAVAAYGIYYSGSTTGTNIVEKNRVYGISHSTSSTSAQITGIAIAGGTTTYKNNMISLGWDTAGNSITASYAITGILESTADANKLYYNTVHVGGTGIGTTATDTYALRRTAATGTDSVRNNIIINSRSNSSTGGKHYAYHISSTSNLISNYNDIYAGGTGGVLGFSSSDRSTLSDWQTGTSKDANSVSTSVTFASTTDLHLSGGSIGDLNLIGIPLTAITTDFDNNTRDAIYPYMGADENTGSPLPVELVSFSAVVNGLNAELKWNTESEVNNYGFEIEKKKMKDEVGSMKLEESIGWEKIGFVEGSGTTNALKEYSFTDSKLTAGKYFYRLKQIDRDGKFEYSQEVEVTVETVPKVFALEQNYPNPFNPMTVISFQIPVNSHVTLQVFDAIGREVAVLVDEMKDAGRYEVQFNAGNLSSGTYFYTLRSNVFSQTKKFLLMK